MSTIFEFKRSIAKTKTSKLLEILAKFKRYEEHVQNAIQNKKIYKFYAAWDIPRLKLELHKRGFVETVPNPFYNLRSVLPLYNLVDLAEDFNDYEQALMCKILGDHPPDFLWTEQPWCYDYFASCHIMNKLNFGSVNFWLKDGSCYYIRAINNKIKQFKNRIKYPRSYNVIEHKETREFQKDFRFTAATSLVLFLNEQRNIDKWFSKTHGKVYYSSLDFALKVIEEKLRSVYTEDNRRDEMLESKKYHHQWKKLFVAHREVVKNHQMIMAGEGRAAEFILRIERVSNQLLKYFPARKWVNHNFIYLFIFFIEPNQPSSNFPKACICT